MFMVEKVGQVSRAKVVALFPDEDLEGAESAAVCSITATAVQYLKKHISI